MTIFLSHPFFLAAAAAHGEERATIFFAQVLLLIAVGRLLGEWMQRIGQPAVSDTPCCFRLLTEVSSAACWWCCTP